MNVAKRFVPQRSTVGPNLVRSISNVRSQAAFVRALLDEIDRAVPPDAGADAAVDEQLLEELDRLGKECVEVARVLASVVDAR